MGMGSVNINESIERAAWQDIFAAAPTETREALGVLALEVEHSLVLVSAGVDNPLVNRAIGFRAGDELAKVVAPFRAVGAERFFVHVGEHERSPALEAQLAREGLVRYRRSWAKLLRGEGPRAQALTDLALRPAEARDANAAAQLYCRAFDLPDAFGPVIAALVGRPRWSVHVAADAGRVVAVGLLFREHRVAYLAGGATHPSYRRRGAQGALVASRVNEALAYGCAWIASETGEAAPGDPQHSFHNMQRAGLVPVGVRHNFAPRGVEWSHGSAA